MARAKRIGEVSDEQYKKAIEWLENGGTKKGACEILGVGSNPTMERMIEEWKDRQITIAEMKKKKRGTNIEGIELANIIEAYLQGDSIEEIADRNYRSTMMVKAALENNGALLFINNERIDPMRPTALYPPILPEETVLYDGEFEPGELVWVSAYQCVGEIIKKISDDAYRIYLLAETKQMYVHQYSWDLGSMRKFKELGVDIKNLGYTWKKEDAYPLIQEALNKARKEALEDGRKRK